MAIVLDQPESPWHGLLAGLGAGITQGMQRLAQEKERKRGTAENIMEKVLMGEIDPMLLSSEEGLGLMSSYGVMKEPGMTELLEQGQRAWDATQPGIGPPAPQNIGRYYDYKSQETEAEKTDQEEQSWRIALERKLKELEQIGEFKSEAAMKRAYQSLKQIEMDARLEGRTIEDIDVNFSTGAVRVNYFTPQEKKFQAQDFTATAGKTFEEVNENYNSLAIKARSLKTSAIKYISGIAGGIEPDEAFSKEFPGLYSLLSSKQAKLMSPKERADLLIRDYNKEIREYNRQLNDLGKKLRIRPDDVIQLKIIGPKLEDVEPPKPASRSDLRSGVNMPEQPEPPSAEELEEDIQALLDLGMVDDNGNPMTRELAKKIVLESLGFKEIR